jgi:hypothetical protein
MTISTSPEANPSSNPYLNEPDRPIVAVCQLMRQLPNDITNAPTLTLEQGQKAHAVAFYADATHRTVLRGLAEIGKLMGEPAFACADGISPLGDLIQHLSVEAELMQDTAQDYQDAAREAGRQE